MTRRYLDRTRTHARRWWLFIVLWAVMWLALGYATCAAIEAGA